MDPDASPVVEGADGLTRCWWCGEDPLYVTYHDTEWGRFRRDDVAIFEKLCLEGFQAGLAWITVLRKRERFREVFAGFEPSAVARFGPHDVDRLVADPGIIRHRGKVESTINNARRAVDAIERHGSLWALVEPFVPEPVDRPRRRADIPASTPESAALGKALRRDGWTFVGPTTVYAFMQALGIVDDHVERCWVSDDTSPRVSP